MAWIESHQSLSRHRKTLRAVASLRVDRHKLIGHLHELWWWGLDNLGPDGDLGDLSDREIAEGAGWSKDPEAFIRAITDAGFIDPVDGVEGGRQLHDWFDYAGKYLTRRAANRERMRAARSDTPTPTVRDHSERTPRTRAQNVQRTDAARAGATVPDQPNQPDRPSADAESARIVPPEALQAFHDVLAGLKGYAPSAAFFEKVATKYGHLDLDEEALKMRAWLAGKGRRSCSTGFVLTWLKHAAEEDTAPPITPPAARNGARRNGHAAVGDDDREFAAALFERSRNGASDAPRLTDG